MCRVASDRGEINMRRVMGNVNNCSTSAIARPRTQIAPKTNPID